MGTVRISKEKLDMGGAPIKNIGAPTEAADAATKNYVDDFVVDSVEKTGRAATYVVAASGAPDHVKAQADFICDGTDDQVEIQAAIDALPAAGGKVVLSDGTFHVNRLSGEVFCIALKSNTVLMGSGMTVTRIRLSDGAANGTTVIFAPVETSDLEVANLELDGNKQRAGVTANAENEGINFKGGSARWHLHDLYVHDCGQDAIDLDRHPAATRSTDIIINRCIMENNGGLAIHQTVERVNISNIIARNNGHDRKALGGSVGADSFAIDINEGLQASFNNLILIDNARGLKLNGTEISCSSVLIFGPSDDVGIDIQGASRVALSGIEIHRTQKAIRIAGVRVSIVGLTVGGLFADDIGVHIDGGSVVSINGYSHHSGRAVQVSSVGSIVGNQTRWSVTGFNFHRPFYGFLIEGTGGHGYISAGVINQAILRGIEFSSADVDDVQVSGVSIQDSVADAIRFGAAATNIHITGNDIDKPITGTPGAGVVIRNNLGHVTENSGTATIGTGVTSVAVNHGLDVTPALQDIKVTPTNNLGAASQFWISNPTSTQFTINVNVDPEGDATFAWQAIVL